MKTTKAWGVFRWGLGHWRSVYF